ncbi:MAG: FRG domain-containing protein [candidate division Zixibacteria bacterium]
MNKDKIANKLISLLCSVECNFYIDNVISNLSDYLATISYSLRENTVFWFRGHSNVKWPLIPSALRKSKVKQREDALNLLQDFRRIAEIKIDRPPRENETLKWLQTAQHYGIPTRLLDWTESSIFALYFATLPNKDEDGKETHGMVFMLNPTDLSKTTAIKVRNTLNANIPNKLLDKYLELGGQVMRSPKKGRLPTIAVNPVWNSERLMMQRGVFTLHGNVKFALDKYQANSLLGIPIINKHKKTLHSELNRIGIDEMALFPELEHACNCLKEKVNCNEGYL